MGYKLDTRIIIEKFKSKEREPETKEIIDIWEDYHKCWTRFKALSGKKFAEQYSSNYMRLDNFVIRYCKKTEILLDIDSLKDYRINLKGKLYTIKYAYDINNTHDYISLECELIGG